MAIFTINSRVSRALDFFSESSVYWGLGGQTPWSNTNASGEVADTPSINDTIPDIFCYKRNLVKHMVRPKRDDEDSTDCIQYRGSYWKIVDTSNAYDEGARWVYLQTSLSYSEVSSVLTYRKIGIFTGCETDGTATDLVYPSEMANPGVLEILDYRKPIYRSSDQQETLNIILEF